MADCATYIVLVNPLKNTVKLGNPFPCLFQFFFRFTVFLLLQIAADRLFSESSVYHRRTYMLAQIFIGGQNTLMFHLR